MLESEYVEFEEVEAIAKECLRLCKLFEKLKISLITH